MNTARFRCNVVCTMVSLLRISARLHMNIINMMCTTNYSTSIKSIVGQFDILFY